MTRKYLRTISLMLPFMVISSVVDAAPTVTKNRYFEARSFSHHEVLRRTAALRPCRKSTMTLARA
jgi:hypothetical protein